MGSGESTRKVTLERETNDGSPGIVRVSESVVRRLKGLKDLPLNIMNEDLSAEDINKLWNELQRERSHMEGQRQNIEAMLERVYDKEQQSQEKYAEGNVFISSKEIQRQQNELDERERMMESRENELLMEIETLEKKNAEIEVVTEDQFNLAVEEVKQKFSQAHRPAVCQDLQRRAVDCYQHNPKHTLRCSQLVQDFVSCVEKSRLKAYMGRNGNDEIAVLPQVGDAVRRLCHHMPYSNRDAVLQESKS